MKKEKNYNNVRDIQQALKIWKMRNLTLKGKIVSFDTIVISKIVFQSFMTTAQKHIVNDLEKIKKAFLWKNYTPQIKHETLCNDYKAGGLKNIDIPNIIVTLQCSWVRRFYDYSFRDFMIILFPLYLIEKSFGTSYKFHSNLLFKSKKIKFFPLFFREIILKWKKHLGMMLKYLLAFCLST